MLWHRRNISKRKIMKVEKSEDFYTAKKNTDKGKK